MRKFKINDITIDGNIAYQKNNYGLIVHMVCIMFRCLNISWFITEKVSGSVPRR
jgi:hypothetical protein